MVKIPGGRWTRESPRRDRANGQSASGSASRVETPRPLRPLGVTLPVVLHLATVRAIARGAAGLPAENSRIRQDQSVEQSKAPIHWQVTEGLYRSESGVSDRRAASAHRATEAS